MKLDTKHKESLLEGLDAIIHKLEVEGSSTGEEQTKRPPSRMKKNSAFEGDVARKVRMVSGLTQFGLTEEIGFNNPSAKTMIGMYETGKVKPGNPPRGEISKKYIEWLKEHGYNPFNL